MDVIKEYKKSMEEIKNREAIIIRVLERDPAQAEYRRLRLVEENLNLLSYYLLFNTLSVNLLRVKNEGALNNARKTYYQAIIYLEQVLSNCIDNPWSDYEEKVSRIKSFDYLKRWNLINKLGFSLQSIILSYGENTKWKWSFIELEARFATLVKNFLNLKTLYQDLTPEAQGYEIKVLHFNLAKKLLEQAALRYREKYELSTLRLDDFQLAIKYLTAVRLLCVVTNNAYEAESIKKKIEVWQQKLDNDLKRQNAAEK